MRNQTFSLIVCVSNVLFTVDGFATWRGPGGTAQLKTLPTPNKRISDGQGETFHGQRLEVAKPKASSATALNMWNRDDDNIVGQDKIAACIPYLLPLLDVDQFGKYIYMRIPPIGMAEKIFLGPLLAMYKSVPFLGLGVFILLAFGSRNTRLSRGVRFSMQQAVLIDIALIFPELFGSLVTGVSNLPRYIVEPASNFVFYTFMACILYSVVSNLTGKKPNQIPIISEAAEQALGPF